MKQISILITFIALSLPAFSVADTSIPPHSCYKPAKPVEFASQVDIDLFDKRVNNYKACIDEFIQQQKEARELHYQAEQNAITDWNNYIEDELNETEAQ